VCPSLSSDEGASDGASAISFKNTLDRIKARACRYGVCAQVHQISMGCFISNNLSTMVVWVAAENAGINVVHFGLYCFNYIGPSKIINAGFKRPQQLVLLSEQQLLPQDSRFSNVSDKE